MAEWQQTIPYNWFFITMAMHCIYKLNFTIFFQADDSELHLQDLKINHRILDLEICPASLI